MIEDNNMGVATEYCYYFLICPDWIQGERKHKKLRRRYQVFAYSLHMRAGQFTIGFCYFSQCFASITSATATTWKHNRQRVMQYFIPQSLWQFTTVWKSFRHRMIIKGINVFSQFQSFRMVYSLLTLSF